MVNNIKVSVVCTAFNHEQFIAQAIDSFLEQQCDFAYEIIIHEDCSTDGTKAIIEAYEKKYPDIIKPIYQPVNIYSKGEKPWVYCFKKAKGDYIALCDGDDYWIDPYKLQKQVDFLESNSNLVACHHWQKDAVKKEGVFVEVDSVKEGHGYYPNSVSEVKHIFSNQMRVKTRTVMFRNIITKTFFPDWFYTLAFGDVPLSYLLGQHGDFGFIDEEMAVYRRIETGASRAGLKELGRLKFNVQHFKNWIEIWDRANSLYMYAYKKEAFSTVSSFYRVIFKNLPLRLQTLTHLLAYNHRRNLPLGMRLRRSFWIVKYFFKLVKQRLLAKLQ